MTHQVMINFSSLNAMLRYVIRRPWTIGASLVRNEPSVVSSMVIRRVPSLGFGSGLVARAAQRRSLSTYITKKPPTKVKEQVIPTTSRVKKYSKREIAFALYLLGVPTSGAVLFLGNCYTGWDTKVRNSNEHRVSVLGSPLLSVCFYTFCKSIFYALLFPYVLAESVYHPTLAHRFLILGFLFCEDPEKRELLEKYKWMNPTCYFFTLETEKYYPGKW